MRRANKLARWTLVLTLAFSSGAALSGCEDENDPHTWVNKLGNDARRPAATARLHRMFEEAMGRTTPPQNPRDPAVRRFLDVALPPLVQAFQAHREDTGSRGEAMSIFALSQDPRAIPALLAALQYTVGSNESERLALRAVQALKDMAPQIPAANRPAVVSGLIGLLDRAQGRGRNPVQIRINSIQALSALHATEAVQPLIAILTRPIAEQDIDTARAAADALGELGDARAVDALVYGLFINIRVGPNSQEAYLYALRGLARLGPAAAVPRLVSTMQGENSQVNQLIQSYATVPGAPEIPPGLVATRTANALATFASADAVQPLLTLMLNTQTPTASRGAAGEALAYTGLAYPTLRPVIQSALTRVFGENVPRANVESDAPWGATIMAAPLGLLGDPASIPLMQDAINNPTLNDAQHSPARVELLGSFAQLARHGNVVTFTGLAQAARTHVQQLMHENEEDPATQQGGTATLQALDRLDRVITVPQQCNDGDMVCYVRMLGNADISVVRKAAYMIAWTTPAASQAQARNALLERVSHPDNLVRRSIMVAIDALSPSGCPDCITRLQALVDSEHNQESRLLSHLDALLLMTRLRDRATHPPPTPPTLPAAAPAPHGRPAH
jgi:HEAT repeat protein